MLEYRLAGADDALAIAAILTATWPDDTADSRRIASILNSDSIRATAAADDDAQLVGFADGFLTVDSQGRRRWEVDLLAVDPTRRNQGIARHLIRQSVEYGRSQGAAFARALVHADNARAARAFAAAGFVADDALRTLLVCSEPLPEQASNPSIFMLPVQTFTYAGHWVEDRYDVHALQSARGTLGAQGGDLVGAVATPADVPHAEASGYVVVGSYRWLTYALTSDAAPAPN